MWKAFWIPLLAAAQAPAPAPVWHIDSGRDMLGAFVQLRTAGRQSRAAEPQRREAERLGAEAASLYAAGKTGEARRRIAHAGALLRGTAWTPREEYAASLVLRPAARVFDSTRPVMMQLDQVYPCDFRFAQGPRLRLLLETPPPARKPVRDLGEQTFTPRDLIDDPLLLEADLRGLADGRYLLGVELLDGTSPVARVGTQVEAVRDLDGIPAGVERSLAGLSVSESDRAAVRYPFDLARLVNLGRRDLPRGRPVAAEVARARELLSALEAGKPPVYNVPGDYKRYYRFEEAGEIMPYRVYVPRAYDGKRALPLVVMLHGLGGSEDVMLDRDGGALKKVAEQHGYLVVTPLGYRPHGGYGRFRDTGRLMLAGRKRVSDLSEKDVMNVLALVRRDYKVDPGRIYLMGHSMGGGGTWTLGAKYPEIWAALAPIASGMSPEEGLPLERIKHLPTIVSQGAKDATAPPEASRAMVARLREIGAEPVYVEFPEADHGTIVAAALPGIFEFFDKVVPGTAR